MLRTTSSFSQCVLLLPTHNPVQERNSIVHAVLISIVTSFSWHTWLYSHHMRGSPPQLDMLYGLVCTRCVPALSLITNSLLHLPLNGDSSLHWVWLWYIEQTHFGAPAGSEKRNACSGGTILITINPQMLVLSLCFAPWNSSGSMPSSCCSRFNSSSKKRLPAFLLAP